MKLIDEWRRVALKAWSVRLALLATTLSAAEVGVQIVAPAHTSGAFAALAALVSLAAGLARLVSQPKLWK